MKLEPEEEKEKEREGRRERKNIRVSTHINTHSHLHTLTEWTQHTTLTHTHGDCGTLSKHSRREGKTETETVGDENIR